MKTDCAAIELHNLFGGDASSRLTVGEVAQALYARTVYTNRVSAREAAFAVMWDYEEQGLVESRPGPRGGAGWTLTPRGAALLSGSLSTLFAG